MKKKLFTRDEFESFRKKCSRKMANDTDLQKQALDVLVKADHYNWLHQTNWMGEPVLNLPQDMFAIQEIIWRTRPDNIIEAGVAWGGGLLFYSTVMEALDLPGKVIGIDTYIPPDLRKRLGMKGRLSKRIKLIKGSSVSQQSFGKVKEIIGGSRRNLVILDSFHAHEHVLSELRMYSKIISKGYYIVCGDTIVENIPEQKHRRRPWGHGNNPMTALRQFLKEDKRFKIDDGIERKLLFTCNPSGYIYCAKD